MVTGGGVRVSEWRLGEGSRALGARVWLDQGGAVVHGEVLGFDMHLREYLTGCVDQWTQDVKKRDAEYGS